MLKIIENLRGDILEESMNIIEYVEGGAGSDTSPTTGDNTNHMAIISLVRGKE